MSKKSTNLLHNNIWKRFHENTEKDLNDKPASTGHSEVGLGTGLVWKAIQGWVHSKFFFLLLLFFFFFFFFRRDTFLGHFSQLPPLGHACLMKKPLVIFACFSRILSETNAHKD